MFRKSCRVFMLFIVFIATMMQAYTFAQTRDVKVVLPNFPVTLNGIQIDNAYRQYPLFVYRDITYFPMTYGDSRFLGLETNWDSNTGLAIEKTGITAVYRDLKNKTKNGTSYTASIPAFAVSINGRHVQATEQYPFLVFRGVTYFPLTWKLAVEEFGWNYHFDAKAGLVVQSANSRLAKAALPGYAGGSFIVAAGHYYYEGERGAIFQAPVDMPGQAKKVYQLPIWDYGDGKTYVRAGLYKADGEAWLTLPIIRAEP